MNTLDDDWLMSSWLCQDVEETSQSNDRQVTLTTHQNYKILWRETKKTKRKKEKKTRTTSWDYIRVIRRVLAKCRLDYAPKRKFILTSGKKLRSIYSWIHIFICSNVKNEYILSIFMLNMDENEIFKMLYQKYESETKRKMFHGNINAHRDILALSLRSWIYARIER